MNAIQSGSPKVVHGVSLHCREMTGRERIFAQLNGRPVDHLPLMPITMQLACDLIGARYLEYATDYKILVEGQIRMAEKFGFDYVNTMSDPACEAADLGAKVIYAADSPPAMDESCALLADKQNLHKLRIPEPSKGRRMSNRLAALDLHRERVGGKKAIEGWVEGPCAEAADLRGLNTLMLDFYDDPQFVKDLFEFVLGMELEFAEAQIAAGAEIVGIGDAAASLVGPRIYEEFVWPYEKRMVDGIQAMGARVRLHICGNTRRILDDIGRLGCDIVDLDFLAPVEEARQAMGPDQILLGNIDPVRALRDSDPASIKEAVGLCHHAAGPRFIVGAGCEIPRDTPHTNLHAMCAYAREHPPAP